jgi:hypothetical protein
VYGGVPGNILRFDGSTGDFVGVFVASGTGGLSYANDLYFGPDGNLYVDNSGGAGKDHGKILRYDAATGNPLPSTGRDGANFITPNDGGLVWANGFAFGPDGMLYVANDFTPNGPSNILRFDGTTGNFLSVLVSSGLGFVDGLVWGPVGNLYVTSNTSKQASVNRYDFSGTLINTFIAPNAGGLQFAAGLLFWDLPDAIAPPGGSASVSIVQHSARDNLQESVASVATPDTAQQDRVILIAGHLPLGPDESRVTQSRAANDSEGATIAHAVAVESVFANFEASLART